MVTMRYVKAIKKDIFFILLINFGLFNSTQAMNSADFLSMGGDTSSCVGKLEY